MPVLGCGMWNLVPWPGTKPWPSALGACTLSHWTAREVSIHTFSYYKHFKTGFTILYYFQFDFTFRSETPILTTTFCKSLPWPLPYCRDTRCRTCYPVFQWPWLFLSTLKRAVNENKHYWLGLGVIHKGNISVSIAGKSHFISYSK